MLCLLSSLMQPFQNQIDERANSDYNAEGYYDDLYGSLCGWTKFETASRVFFGEYRKGEIVGNAIIKTYENFGVLSNHWSRRSRFYEDFEIEASSKYAFRFYRDLQAYRLSDCLTASHGACKPCSELRLSEEP